MLENRVFTVPWNPGIKHPDKILTALAANIDLDKLIVKDNMYGRRDPVP